MSLQVFERLSWREQVRLLELAETASDMEVRWHAKALLDEIRPREQLRIVTTPIMGRNGT